MCTWKPKVCRVVHASPTQPHPVASSHYLFAISVPLLIKFDSSMYSYVQKENEKQQLRIIHKLRKLCAALCFWLQHTRIFISLQLDPQLCKTTATVNPTLNRTPVLPWNIRICERSCTYIVQFTFVLSTFSPDCEGTGLSGPVKSGLTVLLQVVISLGVLIFYDKLNCTPAGTVNTQSWMKLIHLEHQMAHSRCVVDVQFIQTAMWYSTSTNAMCLHCCLLQLTALNQVH